MQVRWVVHCTYKLTSLRSSSSISLVPPWLWLNNVHLVALLCDLALGYSRSEGSSLIPVYSSKEDDCTIVVISPIWTESYSIMAFHFHDKLCVLPDKRWAHNCSLLSYFHLKGCVIMLVQPIQSSNEQAHGPSTKLSMEQKRRQHGNKLPKLW
jgi:hypothetical protein